jgi:hypothetical protein
MHKVWKSKFSFDLCIFVLAIVALLRSQIALAEIRDAQSFKPIEWESDFSKSNSLSVNWFRFPDKVQLALPEDAITFDELRNGFGIQLGQWLRGQWQGRIGFYLASTGSAKGAYVWSFLGSDLQHPLVTGELGEKAIFRYFRPFVYFGLGVSSRWENSEVRYNLIPTFRYEASEPSAYFGSSFLFKLSDEILFGLDFRYFQSARNSRNRFPGFGASVVWGELEKKWK